MELFRGSRRNAPATIVAVAFEPAELAALPRHIRFPGMPVLSHSIDSLRDVDWTDETMPSVVISPLFAGTFDAHDLASLLVQKGFEGHYVAVVNSVLDPKVIRNDVAHVAPNLHFEIVALDTGPLLRAI